MAGERTEQASAQRREKANREGDRLHSRELSSAAGTLAGVVLLGSVGPRFVSTWRGASAAMLDFVHVAQWEPEHVTDTLKSLLTLAMGALAPVGWIGAGVCAAALGAGILQLGGIHWNVSVIGFRLDRINPWSNVRNLFSLRAAARLGKSLVPAAFLAVFALQRLERQSTIPLFSTVRLLDLGHEVLGLLQATAWLLFGWAAVDFLVEWRSREQRLKMSRQELREEYRDSEGNPQIRGRIRNLQRQARRRRLQNDVAKAAVVITNPTHYAVALEFNFETMDAPRMLAKGRNLLADEIKHQARWAGVPILENPPLARSLYRTVEPGQSIPVALYAAVASILAFLYRQQVEQMLRQRASKNAESGPVPPRRRAGNPVSSNTAVIPGHRKQRHAGKESSSETPRLEANGIEPEADAGPASEATKGEP